MGHGDAPRPEVGRLCGVCSPLCGFCLLRCVDGLHPAGYGGTLSLPARAPSALVKMEGKRRQRGKCVLTNINN